MAAHPSPSCLKKLYASLLAMNSSIDSPAASARAAVPGHGRLSHRRAPQYVLFHPWFSTPNQKGGM
jgi:hypothetical protein